MRIGGFNKLAFSKGFNVGNLGFESPNTQSEERKHLSPSAKQSIKFQNTKRNQFRNPPKTSR